MSKPYSPILHWCCTIDFKEVGLELKIIDCRLNHFRANGYIITGTGEENLREENEWGLNTAFSEE